MAARPALRDTLHPAEGCRTTAGGRLSGPEDHWIESVTSGPRPESGRRTTVRYSWGVGTLGGVGLPIIYMTRGVYNVRCCIITSSWMWSYGAHAIISHRRSIGCFKSTLSVIPGLQRLLVECIWNSICFETQFAFLFSISNFIILFMKRILLVGMNLGWNTSKYSPSL